jgi:small subunit ribosomal protein S20
MPHTKSAKKSLRQTAKRRLHNRAVKKGIKVQVKKFLAVLDEGNPDQLRQEFNQAVKKLDKAAGKRVIHRNTAARRKSQLAKKLQGKLAAAAPKA